MFTSTRFFDFSLGGIRSFQSRVRSAFVPRKPRHRLLRFALGVIGLALLALLVMFGVVVGATMLVAGVAYKLLVRRSKPIARDQRIVDAEYRVVAKPLLTR